MFDKRERQYDGEWDEKANRDEPTWERKSIENRVRADRVEVTVKSS